MWCLMLRCCTDGTFCNSTICSACIACTYWNNIGSWLRLWKHGHFHHYTRHMNQMNHIALKVYNLPKIAHVFCHRSDLGLLLHGYLVVTGEAGETGWSLGILPRSRVHSPFRTQVSCSGYISRVGNVEKCSAQVEWGLMCELDALVWNYF